MITEMLKIELRKVAPYYAPFLSLVVGYILFIEKPLANDDAWVVAIAIVQGCVIAWRLFRDAGGTESFIFSRPLSRRRLFFTRWAIGVSFQLLTVVVVFAAIAFGIRGWLQIQMGSPYHPMVKWYELSVLWPIGLFSILAYEVQLFLNLRMRALSSGPDTKWGIVSTGLILMFIGSMLFATASAGTILLLENPRFVHPFRIYVMAVIIVATMASAHCYRYLEVEA